MTNIKLPIFLICSVIVFVFTGCQSGHATSVSKDVSKSITINENDVKEIRTWGKDTGESGKGVLLYKAKSVQIIKWVNSAKITGEAKLPPEMKAPNSQISIYLTSNKTIQIFLFGGDLIIDSYKAEQEDLIGFLKQNER